MALLSLFVGYVLEEPDTDLGAALAKLSKEPIAYRRLFDDKKVTANELTKWFEKCGVAAKFRDDQVVKSGLLLKGYTEAVVRVQGTDRDLVGLVSWATSGADSHSGAVALVLFSQHGADLQCDVLHTYPGEGVSVQPTEARSTKDKIIILGERFWFSNAPNGVVSLARLTKGGWKVASDISQGESLGREEFIRTKGRVTALRMVSRTYPKNLTVSHAAAQRSIEEVWSLTGDKPVLTLCRARVTPYNTLDAIYPMIQRGRQSELRPYCMNDSIAKKLAALAKKARGSGSVRFVDSVCDTEAKTIGLGELKTWFTFVRSGDRYVVASLRPMTD